MNARIAVRHSVCRIIEMVSNSTHRRRRRSKMRRSSTLARYFLILAIVTAAAFLIPLGPVADAIAGEPPAVKPLPAAGVFDARAYAAEYGVNVKEARRRLRAQNQMSGITDLLRRGTGKRFAGLW